MNAALLVTLLATLTRTVPIVPGFGTPWFEKDKSPNARVLRHVAPGKTALRQPQMNCNMPMIRPKTHVDPKIIFEVPKDADYKIRILDTPCQQERRR